MCAPRKDGEPWLFYAFRYLADQPRTLMAFVGMAAAVGVYADNRQFTNKAIDRLDAVTAELRDINVKQGSIDNRLEHLEREHECSRQNQTFKIQNQK